MTLFTSCRVISAADHLRVTVNKHSGLQLTEHTVNVISVFYAGFVLIVLCFV